MKTRLVFKKLFSPLNNMLAPRAFSVFIFTALLCTLAAKFFHAWVCRWTNRISSTKYNTKPKI
jgi:isopentenyldiphosphate isomerase